MKKVIALILLTSILFLTGCSESSGTNSGKVAADELSIGFRASNYEAYLSHMADYVRRDGTLSDSFVMADRLFVLGAWNSFSFEWDGPPESSANGQWYRYWLNAPSISHSVKIMVEIFHQPKQASIKTDLLDLCPTVTLSEADYALSESMAQLRPREKPFNIERNGVTYGYYKTGELWGIFIEVKGILYWIDIDPVNPGIYKKLDKTSVLARLLSLDEDTAKAAYKEIKAALTK